MRNPSANKIARKRAAEVMLKSCPEELFADVNKALSWAQWTVLCRVGPNFKIATRSCGVRLKDNPMGYNARLTGFSLTDKAAFQAMIGKNRFTNYFGPPDRSEAKAIVRAVCRFVYDV